MDQRNQNREEAKDVQNKDETLQVRHDLDADGIDEHTQSQDCV